jgi:hypothetical protein
VVGCQPYAPAVFTPRSILVLRIVGCHGKIPSDATGDRSRDLSTSSLVPYPLRRPRPYIKLFTVCCNKNSSNVIILRSHYSSIQHGIFCSPLTSVRVLRYQPACHKFFSSWCSSNLWPLRFCLSAGNRWQSLGFQFPWHNYYKCRLCVMQTYFVTQRHFILIFVDVLENSEVNSMPLVPKVCSADPKKSVDTFL